MLVVAGWPWTMRPSFFPCGSQNIDSACATAIHVSGSVDLQAIGSAGLGTGEVRKYPVDVCAARTDLVDGENRSAHMMRPPPIAAFVLKLAPDVVQLRSEVQRRQGGGGHAGSASFNLLRSGRTVAQTTGSSPKSCASAGQIAFCRAKPHPWTAMPHARKRKRAAGVLRAGSASAGWALQRGGAGYAFFATGTGMPATLRLTEPSMVRLVKNSVFQSLPPKPMLVVAGWPCKTRPSLLPLGSRM
jgi:hypothetical protein